MNARFALPGCSFVLWTLFTFLGLSLQTFNAEQNFHYRWLPALMALGSLALLFLARVRYGDVAAQIFAIIMLLVFAAFFLSYTGGV